MRSVKRSASKHKKVMSRRVGRRGRRNKTMRGGDVSENVFDFMKRGIVKSGESSGEGNLPVNEALENIVKRQKAKAEEALDQVAVYNYIRELHETMKNMNPVKDDENQEDAADEDKDDVNAAVQEDNNENQEDNPLGVMNAADAPDGEDATDATDDKGDEGDEDAEGAADDTSSEDGKTGETGKTGYR